MNNYHHSPYARAMLFLLFAGGMTVFFSDPTSAKVGTTRGKLAKGDTQERAMKPVQGNLLAAVGAAPTGSRATSPSPEKTTITHPNTSAEKLDAANKAAGKTEHVVVIGDLYKTGATADYANKEADLGALGDRKLQDTPYSVMQVTGDVMKNEQVRNLNDVFKYLPSVQLEQRGDPGESRPQSRGFEADVEQNSRFDGLNGLITTPYPTEIFSKVTVLNGLAGSIYGAQNPAGTFDFTLKRPTDNFFANFNMGADSGGAPLEHLDIGNRGFGGKAKWFGYRINLLNQQGEYYTNNSHMRRDLVSGDFDIHLTKHTVLELDAMQYTTAYRGLPGMFGFTPEEAGGKNTISALPNAPDIHHDGYGQKAAGYSASTSMGQIKLKHEINKNWNISAGVMYEDAARNNFTAANTFTDNNGDYTQKISSATTADDFRTFSNFAYLRGKFQTGSILGQDLVHHINIGSNGYWLGNYNPTQGESYSLRKASLSDPHVLNNLTQPYHSGRYRSATTREQNFLVGDTLDIGKHLSIMGQLSWTWIREENYGDLAHPKGTNVPCHAGAGPGCQGVGLSDIGRKGPIEKANAAFSPSAAIIYKVNPNLSAYFSWGRSVTPGMLIGTAATSQGNVLSNVITPVMTSTQYEGGIKYNWKNRLQMNLAGFDMSRPFYFNDKTSPNGIASGNQHNYGIEAQISGKITRDLSVLAGMTWLESHLGDTGPNNKGTAHKQVVGVPNEQANILLDYRPHYVKGLGFNANIHYMGRRAADVYNETYANGYVTLDLGARYAYSYKKHDFLMRFNVNNITGENYWSSVFPSSINGSSGTASVMAGLPRTWSVTASTFF